MPMMTPLLEKLREKQGKLSDNAFSCGLGVSQQLWQMTRSGKRGIGLTLLKGVSKTYPDLAPYVLFFLGFDVSKYTVTANNITNTPETHQDANLRRFIDRVKKMLFKRSKECL